MRIKQGPKNKKSKNDDDQIVSIDSGDDSQIVLGSSDEEESKIEDEDDESKETNLFKIMSWNIDGLDSGNLQSRTKGVIKKILK